MDKYEERTKHYIYIIYIMEAIVVRNLFSICSFSAIVLDSFTMPAAVWCFSFLYLCVIFSLKS